jgi:hypothetical protein
VAEGCQIDRAQLLHRTIQAAAADPERWELGLPDDGSRRCSADFTIDDLELAAAP